VSCTNGAAFGLFAGCAGCDTVTSPGCAARPTGTRVARLRRVALPTVNERITSEFAADTEDDGTSIFPSPEPVGLRRPSLPYATPRMVAHPRLIPRADLADRKRTAAILPPAELRPTTVLERPRRRLARSSSPELRADNEFDFAVGSAPSPMPRPPMSLPARRGTMTERRRRCVR
jgi:hypothetical protein